MSNPNLTSEQDIQQWLVGKVSEITNLDSNEIDIDKEIMSYGLDSSALMLVIGELSDIVKKEISMDTLQNKKTISDIAVYVSSQ